MGHVISMGAALFATWLLLSGHFTGLLIGFGVASCLVVLVIARRMDVIDREAQPVHMTPRTCGYWVWLVKEIVLANIDVAKRIITPGLPIEPHLIRVKATQRDELGKVIYANSITLTPGTVTVDIDGEEFLVHALSQEAADDLATGEMDRRVTALEGEG